MKVENRLPYLRPEELDEEQRKLYDYHLEVMQPMPYCWITADGELNGPSNAMMHNAEIGNMLFPLNRALIKKSVDAVGWQIHELVILTVVSSAKAAYGIYAHTRLARKHGLDEDKIAAIVAGQRAASFTDEENVAYDLALALAGAGPMPDIIYSRAVETFGEGAVLALTFVAGNFKMVGTILNTYNEPVPAEDA